MVQPQHQPFCLKWHPQPARRRLACMPFGRGSSQSSCTVLHWPASTHTSLAPADMARHSPTSGKWRDPTRALMVGWECRPRLPASLTGPQLGTKRTIFQAPASLLCFPDQCFQEQSVKINCILWILGGTGGTSCYQNAWANFKSIRYA